MKRFRGWLVGLLDLPPEVLRLILSFLGTLSLAAARLTCRALHTASTSDRRLVTIKVEGWCTAKARASPRVLTLIHTFESLLAGLKEAGQGDGGKRGVGTLGNRRARAWLQTDLLTSVAREVESLCIENQWKLGADQQGAKPKKQLLCEPHVLLSKMSALTSVRLKRPLDTFTLHELGSLACLQLSSLDCKLGHEYFVQHLCSMPALTQLDLGASGVVEGGEDEWEDRFDSESLTMLASGRVAGLRRLAMPLPAGGVQHLDMLTALTALTYLHVWSWDLIHSWSSVASLTGLKALRMEGSTSDLDLSAETILTPLTALQSLTSLDIVNSCVPTPDWGETVIVPWNSAVLSHLTSLHVLRCNLHEEARLVDGEALPVQLRFLITATNLEDLDLGFLGSFWTLPLETILAMQQAVSSLASLKHGTVDVQDNKLKHYSAPLAVFAAASSLEILEFACGGRRNSLPGKAHNLACACFKRLKKLKSFEQLSLPAPLHFTELLMELSSTQLTSLSLYVETATAPLMQHIAGFRNLEKLSLAFVDVSLRFLEPLYELKELTSLKLKWQSKPSLRVRHGAAASAIFDELARLKASILESARRVGVVARVEMVNLQDDD